MAIDFPSSPTTNQTVTVGSKTWVYDGAKWNSQLVPSVGPTGPQGASANRNVIINGAFDIWQRGTSFSNPSSAYTADRFVANGPSGDTVSQQTFTPGTAPVAGYEPQFYLRYATGATAGSRYFFQRVEDVRTLAGQTVSFSFWARVNTGTVTLYPYFYQQFGSGGSADNSTAEGSFIVTTSWQRFTYTTTMPSMSGKTIGSGSSVQGAFRFIDINKNLDIWGVQLESGSTATTFQRNAPSIQAELAACQRYYWRQTSASASDTYYGFATGFANSTTSAWISPFFPVQMRIAPSFSSSAASTFQMFNNGGIINATSTALGRSGVTSATINIGAASGLVANAGLTFEARNTNSAFLEFNAEL